MSKNIVWSLDLRVQLYTAVIKVMGHPTDVPRGARGKPIGMSKADYINTLDSIGILIGVGSDKGGALSTQIAWLTCLPSINCHKGHWNNRWNNLEAANVVSYFYKSPSILLPIPTPPTKRVSIKVSKDKGIFSRAWSNVKGWFS